MVSGTITVSRPLIYALIALAVIDAVTLAYGIFEGAFPSYVDRGSATAYKNMYVHIQLGWATYLFFTIALVAAIVYLIRRDARMEKVAHVSITLGWLYGAAAWITGTLWSAESWGAWWSWDPRQTSVLFLLIAYAVYYIIRSSIRDPDVATRLSMVYAIAAYAVIPLSFVLPLFVEALHPTPRETFRAGAFSIGYMFLRAFIVIALGLLLARVLYLRIARNVAPPKSILIVPAIVLAAALVSSLPIISGFLAGSSPDLDAVSEGESVRFFGVVVEGNIVGLSEAEKTYDLELKILSGDREVGVVYSGEFILEPPVVEVKRGDVSTEIVTLLGHYVVVEGVKRDGLIVASSIEVVTAWCVAASAIGYALTLIAVVAMIYRGV